MEYTKEIYIGKAIVIAIVVLLLVISFQSSITANMNKPLTEEFTISIIKPENAIYRNNQKLIPFCAPLVLRGSIDVEIEVTPSGTQLDRMEIYVDNELYNTIQGPGPFDNYVFTVEGNTLSKIKIEVLGYGIDDTSGEEAESTIWRIFQ